MRKLALVALAALASFVPACSEGSGDVSSQPLSSEGPVGPDGEIGRVDQSVTAGQLRAFRALQVESHREWRWMQHETLGTPMHLEAARGTGEPVLSRGASTVEIGKATVALVGRYKDLFKMRDAESELRLDRAEVDELAMTHARFQQMAHGIPVVGAQLAAHYDTLGRVTSIDANYVAGIEGLDLEPTVDRAAVAAQVTDDVVSRTEAPRDRLTTSEGKLVVFALGGRAPVLAYEYSVRAVFGHDPAIWVTTVDAHTGEIIDRYNNLQTVEATGAGVLGTAKKFQVTQSGTSYSMMDASRGAPIRTYNAASAETMPGTGVTSTSLTSWDRVAVGPGAAVDAHVHAAAVYDYYKNKHARNAIDGAGSAMISTAHFGQQYENAFWDPDQNQMAYGDGATMFRPLSAGLDVVAHEFTHGVTSATSDLRYQGQSGALNEAVSDIFGVFIEHSVKPDDTKNWTMGEDIVRQAGLTRDFKNPAVGQQPAHMTRFVNTQQDSGGVHINSGIINHAAYLMTAGGTNPVSKVAVKFGLGWEKSEKLWYRANTKYFLATTNFAQAAVALGQAAKDIPLSANETAIVDCAWKATGIVSGACAAITDPAAEPQNRAPGTEDTTEDGTAADGTEDTASETKTTKRPRTALAPDNSSGCSTSGGNRGFGGLALAGLVAALVAARRRVSGTSRSGFGQA